MQDGLDDASARTVTGAPAQAVILPDAVHTAAATAAALGIQVDQIVNSLIFDSDGEPLLVLTSGGAPGGLRPGRRWPQVAKLGRSTPEFVWEQTGLPIGGVAAVGQPKLGTHPARHPR